VSKPPFVIYETFAEYKLHYERQYCRSKIFTFDNIWVRFRSAQFAHAFYESSAKDGFKDCFAWERAKRMDWIKETLINPNADLYQGRDKRNNSYNQDRRISVVYEGFVVIIDITKKGVQKDPVGATFVTAYPADDYAIKKIKSAPKWKR
jgi:hypothetical protein